MNMFNRHFWHGYFLDRQGKKYLHSLATEIFFNEDYTKKRPSKVTIKCVHVLIFALTYYF